MSGRCDSIPRTPSLNERAKAFPKWDSLARHPSSGQAFLLTACGACLEAEGHSLPARLALGAEKSPQAAAGAAAPGPHLFVQWWELSFFSGVLRLQPPCWEGLWAAGHSPRPPLRRCVQGPGGRKGWMGAILISALVDDLPVRRRCYSQSCLRTEASGSSLFLLSVPRRIAGGLFLEVSLWALGSPLEDFCRPPLFP